MVGVTTDKYTLDDKNLQALHSAYLDKEDLHRKSINYMSSKNTSL